MKKIILISLLVIILSSCNFLSSFTYKQIDYTLEYNNGTEEQLNSSISILKNRLKSYGLKKIEFKKLKNKLEISFSAGKHHKKDIINDLLTAQGNLEFCETYYYSEVYNYFFKVEEALIKDNFLKKNRIQLKGSEKKIKYAKEHPLAYILSLNTSYSGVPNKDAKVGYCKVSDTMYLNKIINNRKYTMLLPNKMQLFFEHKPFIKDNISYFNLIAIKNNKLSGNMIFNTRIIKDKITRENQIEIIFNKEYTKKWAIFTEKNISRQIAIVIDNIVLSAPTVISQIEGGRIVITGHSIQNELEAMVHIIKYPALNIKFKIIK